MRKNEDISQVPPTLNPLVPVLVPLVLAAIVAGLVLNHFIPAAANDREVPAAQFSDATSVSGINHVSGSETYFAEKRMGAGVVCFDFDGDGFDDLFFVGRQSLRLDETDTQATSSPSALYRNDGHGKFEEVTPGSGLEVPLTGVSAAAGDYDNDGRPDLFVTCVGRNRLFRNAGFGKFIEVSGAAGISDNDNVWSTGAAWVDLDGDGWLDLVVCHYAQWPSDMALGMAVSIDTLGRSYGAPSGFFGVFPSVYLNRRDGTLALVEKPIGIGSLDTQTGSPAIGALAVVPLDSNGDGRLDLLVLNRDDRSDLFVNEGNGRFKKWLPEGRGRNEGVGLDLIASNAFPMVRSSDDPRWDVWLDRLNLGTGSGRERTKGWAEDAGLVLFDYDHEGPLSVFGRMHDASSAEPDATSRPGLYLNRGDKWLSAPQGPGLEPLAGAWSPVNGVATGDFDGDGNVDLVVTRLGKPALLLKNAQRGAAPWLSVALKAPKAGDLCGAKVELHTPRRTTVQTWAAAMGPFAQSDGALWFGLGADSRVQRLVVHWRDGTTQELVPDGINRRYVISKAR